MNGEYDVIVIGGGINGAAIAAALTRRGYRLLLLEQRDFASGTTAASTKLIHGGLRYLEYGDARLVHESLQSRERLLRERPHLVKSLPFVLPVYDGDSRRGPYIRAGLVLYDILTPRKVSPWHRSFSRRELQRFEPAVATEGLASAYLYHDAQVEMPERLCIEYLSEARERGADVRNYSAVDFIVVRDGQAQGVDYHDVMTGERFRANGRMIINAAGPWVDAVLEATGRPMRRRLSATKGSHLVVQLGGRGPRHAILASARSDGRPIFVVPWLDHHLIGTTDTRYDGDPGAARCEDWEVDYLLREANRLLPGIGVQHSNVLYSYSGARPLPATESGVAAGAISRRAFVVDHEPEGVAHLISIVGGKLTTATRLGVSVGRAVQRAIGSPPRGGRPHALPRGQAGPIPFLPQPTVEHLQNRYGQRAADVAAYAALHPNLAEPLGPSHPDIGAQVAYAVEREGAKTVGDVLLRRTPVGLTHDLGRAAAPNVAAIMQDHFDWSDAERDQAVRDYEMELHRTVTVFDHPNRRAATAPSPRTHAADVADKTRPPSD